MDLAHIDSTLDGAVLMEKNSQKEKKKKKRKVKKQKITCHYTVHCKRGPR
jgi:hypothetical protein